MNSSASIQTRLTAAEGEGTISNAPLDFGNGLTKCFTHVPFQKKRSTMTMTQQWDEFSKSLAEDSIPRRESLRRLGAVLAGAILSPLVMKTAWADEDPCKIFCRCRNKTQQSQCLTACRACNKDMKRVCGTCGSYVCCGNGTSCCGNYCTDLGNDPYNCGACGYACHAPGPYEDGACIFGECEYTCFEGAVRCNGTCTFLDSDPGNCGACGNVCGDSTPYCNQGACTACSWGLTKCGNTCVDLAFDSSNCGACGNVCGESTPYCSQGACTACAGAICEGQCVDLMWDSRNCGACGVVCPEQSACAWGVCEGIYYGGY